MNLKEIEGMISQMYPQRYSEVSLSLILQEIMVMEPDIRQELENFLSGRKYKNLSSQGYSIKTLESEQGMNTLAAFLTIDWINKSPDEALPSLKKGHDYIKF